MRSFFFPTTNTDSFNKYKKTNWTKAPEVLLADDDPESVELLQNVLTSFGFNVTLAFDGKKAMEALTKRYYDIVFLDENMPSLKGTEVLEQIERIKERHLSKNEDWRTLPVIFYSSAYLDNINLPQEEGFKFVGFWHKPLSIADLVTLTRRAVNDLKIQLPEVG
ncbi:MAG: response regulator [Oligoflexia bacterium]|nr:response regulator [Oligoflexia bacterium]